ncbi:MAG: restriction endonuclease subunit S [Gemmataceae bacterium]
MTEELPDGWVWTKLGEVVDRLQYGFTAKAIESKNGTRFLRITDLRDDGVEWSKVPSCAISDSERTKYQLHDGDLVFARTGSIEKAWLVQAPPDSVFASYLIRARPMSLELAPWLGTFITSHHYRLQIREIASGIGRENVNATNLGEIDLPVPPLVEQRRIVAKIEELTARSGAAREALADIPAMLEQLRQSVLASAFRGDLTVEWRAKRPDSEPASELLTRVRAERRKHWDAKYPKKKYVEPDSVEDSELPELPEEWEYARADEIAATGTIVTYGIVLPGDQVADGVPYVRGQDIEDGRILVEQLARTSHEIAARHERSSLHTGDVLLCIIRHLKVAIVPEGMDGANLTQGTVRIRPSEAINGPFLAGYLASPEAQKWMKERYFGMAMPRINVEDARAIPIPVAPMAEQQAIVRILEGFERYFSKVRDAVGKAIEDLSAINQSILAKAFRGELVPQDPTDEPASVLLERIRSGPSEPKAPKAITRGKLSRIVLLLLHHWNNAASRELLDRGMLLMLDDDLRRRLASGGSKPKRKKRSTPTSAPPISFPHLLGAMIDAGFVTSKMKGSVQTLQANTQKAKQAHDTADPDDLARLRETMKVMELIEEKQLDAELAEAFRGQEIAITV